MSDGRDEADDPLLSLLNARAPIVHGVEEFVGVRSCLDAIHFPKGGSITDRGSIAAMDNVVTYGREAIDIFTNATRHGREGVARASEKFRRLPEKVLEGPQVDKPPTAPHDHLCEANGDMLEAKNAIVGYQLSRMDR